jgi:hypothetical protein
MATVMAIHTTLPITKRRANLMVKNFSVQIFGRRTGSTAFAKPNMLYGLLSADPVQWAEPAHWRENPMKKLVFAILLIASPAWAQTKLLPKSVTARADPCAPIGRTADGKLVYSMKCENLPAPPSPPPQAEISAPPAPEPEVQRSGFFGLSYERKRPGE